MDISLEFDIDYTDHHDQTAIVDNSDEMIKDYLHGKIDDLKRLSEISNKNLRASKEHQNQCLKYLKESEYSDGPVEVKNIWQRIHNDKWIVGVRVENTAERIAENMDYIIRCIPKQKNVEYSIQLYVLYNETIPEELENLQKNKYSDVPEIFREMKESLQNPPKWISTQKIEKEATIVLQIIMPKFVNFREIKLQGIITYEMANKSYQKKLTDVCLQVDDILTDDLSIKLNSIINGTEEAFLSVLSTSRMTFAKVIIPEGLYRTLQGILELDCSFTKTDIPGDKMILVYDGKSHSLSYCMLKFTPGKNDVEIITKNEQQLQLLYHHLYKNIPDVIILNENCEQILNHSAFLTRPTQIFLEPVEQDQSILKEFSDAFDDQLTFLENKIKNSNRNKTKDIADSLVLCETVNGYKLFRNDLSALEKKSDELFIKAFDKKL